VKRLKSTYGLEWDNYVALIEKQQGKCAICGKLCEKLCVDHDHTTWVVCGLLCRKCNTVIGLFSDDTNLLGRVIQYLKKYKDGCVKVVT